MAGVKRQLPGQADLFDLPVLPEVLLQCSKSFKADGFEDTLLCPSENSLYDMMVMDPALTLKVLGLQSANSYRIKNDGLVLKNQLKESSFRLLWAQSAVSLEQLSQNSTLAGFLRKHWLQSVRASFMMEALAEKLGYRNKEQAKFCGLLMYAGKLVLLSGIRGENNHPDLHSSKQTSETESKPYDVTHNQLLAGVLENLGLPDAISNALLYQHEEAMPLKHAPVLSRLQWAAEKLIGSNEPFNSAVSSAAGLLGLEINELMVVRERADIQAQQLANDWGIDTGEQSEKVESYSQNCIRQVKDRFHAMALSGLLKESVGATVKAESSEKTRMFIEQGLVMTLGSRGFLLMCYDRDAEVLKQVSSNLDAELVEGLAVTCGPDSTDGFIATDSFQQSELLCRTESELGTVLDKQLLKSLDAMYLNAFPLITGERQVGVFIAGSDTKTGSETIRTDFFLRSFLSGLAERLLVSGQPAQHSKTDGESSDASLSGKFIDQRSFRNMVHEVKNPLSIIKNYLHLLGLKLEENNEIQEDLKILDSEIGRVTSILNRYHEGKNMVNQGLVSLNQQVENIIRVVAASLDQNSGVTINTDLEPDLAKLDCEEDKVRQIITNLVKNAVEALQEGGEINVITSLELDMTGNEYQKLIVSDNGPGLDDEIRNKLFQHGYTTKGEGHSGAGLAITRDLIEELRGTINCQSSRKGTSFSLLLPVTRNT